MAEGPIAQKIRQKLQSALSPQRIELEDDSWRHAGHHHEGGMDAQPGGETHFNLVVVADAFVGQSRVQRQRMINSILTEELSGGVHALSVKARTPAEFEAG